MRWLPRRHGQGTAAAGPRDAEAAAAITRWANSGSVRSSLRLVDRPLYLYLRFPSKRS
jgi:hypothetical protein